MKTLTKRLNDRRNERRRYAKKRMREGKVYRGSHVYTGVPSLYLTDIARMPPKQAAVEQMRRDYRVWKRDVMDTLPHDVGAIAEDAWKREIKRLANIWYYERDK